MSKKDNSSGKIIGEPNLASIMNRLEKEEKEQLFQKWLNMPLQEDPNCIYRENVDDNYTHCDFINEFLHDLFKILGEKKYIIKKNKVKAFKNEIVNLFYKRSLHNYAVH